MLYPYSLSVKALKKSMYLQMFERHNIASAQRMIYTTPEEELLAGLAGVGLPAGELVPLGASASSASRETLRALSSWRDFFKQQGGEHCCSSEDSIPRRGWIAS
jgi:hypothetical protein